MKKMQSETNWDRVKAFNESDTIPFDPEDGPYNPNDAGATRAWLEQADLVRKGKVVRRGKRGPQKAPTKKLKAVRGTRDLLPPETALWNRIEATARDVFARYNFGEIRTPVFEDTALFARGVGEETDIVSKEMYTWEDRARAQSEKTQSLTLRPENTAGVVRAYIEHKLGESGQLQKLYYIGPQFRRERPQKGRYRQFSQIGAEVIGPPSRAANPAARRRSPGDAGHAARRAGHHRLDAGAELRWLGRRPRPLQRRRCARLSFLWFRRCARTASAAPSPIRCACWTARFPPTSRSSRRCR
jgi:hypothetical protein